MNMKSADRVALHSFNARKNVLVAVAGTGSNQHLETRRIRFAFIGRFLRWLNIAYRDTNPRKVALYVAQHIAEWKTEDFLVTQRIVLKLQKFQKKHPHELTSSMQQISKAYNERLAAYHAARGLPVPEQERFNPVPSRPVPSRKDPVIQAAALKEADTYRMKETAIAQMTGEQINALKPNVLLKLAPKLSRGQIPLIQPSKITGELIDQFKDDYVQELNEAQLRQLTEEDLNVGGYFNSPYKRLTPGQIRLIQDKLTKAWIEKLDFPRQFEELDWEAVTPDQLLEMPLLSSLSDDKYELIAPCLNKMTVEEFKKLRMKIRNETRLIQVMSDLKLKEFAHLCVGVNWGDIDSAIVQKLDLAQFDQFTIDHYLLKKLLPSQINAILHKVDSWGLKKLSKEILQQLDAHLLTDKHIDYFFPVENLSVPQLNILLPKLTYHFSSLPLSLFLKLDLSRMTEIQISSLSSDRLRRIPSATIQQLLDKMNAFTCFCLSPAQIQGLNAKLLTPQQISKLSVRLDELTVAQLFDCHTKIGKNQWVNCDRSTLIDLLKNYGSRMNPEAVAAIKQCLAGHIPGGHQGGRQGFRWAAPVELYLPLPASLSLATFKENDPTSAEKACYWSIQALHAAIQAKKEKKPENTNALYLSIGAKLKEKQVAEFVNLAADAKAVWRKILLLTHPDKTAAHPRKKELEEAFKYFSALIPETIDENVKESKKGEPKKAEPKKAQPAPAQQAPAQPKVLAIGGG